jgi:hypothetical protein
MRLCRLNWVVLFAAMMPVAGRSAPVVQQRGPAALRTEAPVDQGVLALSFTDQLALVVEVIGEAGLEVRAPQKWVGELWRLGRAQPPERENLPGGRVRWLQALWLEPVVPGELVLQLESISYRDRGRAWQTVAWQPLTVRVQARLKDPDLKSARDIAPIEELPGLSRTSRWRWLVLGGLAAGVLVALLAWRLWPRSPASSGSGSLEARSLRDLDRLLALGLPQRGKAERFGTLLAGLMRRYLERKHGVPARRQTTREFLAALALLERLDGQRPWLEQFFGRCDQIKFAPVQVSLAECERLAGEVRDFLGGV